MQSVSLREITHDTVRAIISLDVSPAQRRYVASNAISIAEAHFNSGAWFRAIYAGETPVGFVMLFDPTIPGAAAHGPIQMDEVGLWRLMVDIRHQRQGFGGRALDLICDHLRVSHNARKLLSSYVPGPDGPEGFYMAYGFNKTGHMRNNGSEVEIVLPLV